MNKINKIDDSILNSQPAGDLRKRNGLENQTSENNHLHSQSSTNSDTSHPFTRWNVLWEWVIRFILLVALGCSEHFMTPFVRKIQRSEWHLYMNPYKKDTVSVAGLFGVMALIPIVGCVSGFFTARRRLNKKNIKVSKRRSKEKSGEGFNSKFNLCDPHSFVWCDAVDMLLSFSLAVLIVMTFGNYAKYWVGRPRPDYFDRCFNYITKETDPDSAEYLKNKNVDINDIKATGKVLENFYTVGADSEVKSFECYKHDEESRAKILTEGLKSFPSGHALSAAVVFWFCSLYVWGKLQAFAPHKRFQSWRFVIGCAPLVPLLYTLITRTSDYRHHWQDVCVGGLFGMIGAQVCYRLYYPELSSAFCHYSYRQQYWLLDYDESNMKDKDDLQNLHEMRVDLEKTGIRGSSFKMSGSQKPTIVSRNPQQNDISEEV